MLTDDEILQLIDETEPLELNGLEYSGGPQPGEVQAVDKGKMSARFTLCTTKLNRQGNAHILMPNEQGKGLQLHEHRKNPVVLFEHGFTSLPFPAIGKSEDQDGTYTVEVMQTKAVGTVFFSQSNPDAQVIFGMVDEKVLNMASIGFDAIKGIRLKQKGPEKLGEGVESLTWQRRGLLFTETVLKEWSIVAAGADLGAMAQTLSRGKFHGEKVTDAMREFLQSLVGDQPRTFTGWSPDATADLQTDLDSVVKVTMGDVTFEGPARSIQAIMPKSLQPLPGTETETPVDKQAQAGETLENNQTQKLPDLAGQFKKKQEVDQQKQADMAAIQQSLTKGFAKMLDEKLTPIKEGQEALEAKFGRLTGQ